MAERTLSTVTKEIDQIAGEITSLEAQIQSKRQKLTDLVQEQIAMQSETLGRFGLTLGLTNSTDSLPVDKPKRAPRGTGTPQNPNAERNAKIREWAAQNGHELKAKGKIPDNVIAQYEAANSS